MPDPNRFNPGVLVEFEAPPFMAVLFTPEFMLFSTHGNGVDSLFLRCGSTKLTLVPGGLSVTDLSWAIEFLNSAFSTVVLAHCVHSGL